MYKNEVIQYGNWYTNEKDWFLRAVRLYAISFVYRRSIVSINACCGGEWNDRVMAMQYNVYRSVYRKGKPDPICTKFYKRNVDATVMYEYAKNYVEYILANREIK